MSRAMSRAARQARPWAAAVGAYLAITLGVPLLNGASENPSFPEHAAWVLACTALALATRLAIGNGRRLGQGRDRRGP